MMGVFVQVNDTSRRARSNPLGYVIQESGCWEWVGGRSGNGYGAWTVGGRQRGAHCVMYERHKGPVPKGLCLDHLCRNIVCVNPDHLEAVTIRENLLRGESAQANNARKTHCKHGHEYTPENTMPVRGGKWCRACHRAAGARRRAAGRG